MILAAALRKDFYAFYNKNMNSKSFENFEKLIFYFTNMANDWAKENSPEIKLDPQITYSIVLSFIPQKDSLIVPFILTPSRELLLNSASKNFSLNPIEGEKLLALILNFNIKILIENELGHKFIRFAFELMENRLNEIKKFENTQKESLANLSKGTTAPIHELEPLILNFINSQFQNYPEFKFLKNVEELINRKKEFFPEIFTTGKPKTIAFNEFIYGLYSLISEGNSNYMPFIKYVVDELNQINPKYFERNNISVEALRKKVKDQIKLISK